MSPKKLIKSMSTRCDTHECYNNDNIGANKDKINVPSSIDGTLNTQSYKH